MPIQLLPVGTPVTLLANQVYALPASSVWLYTDAISTLAMSNSSTFASNFPISILDGGPSGTYSQYKLKSGFIKATTDTLITLKRD